MRTTYVSKNKPVSKLTTKKVDSVSGEKVYLDLVRGYSETEHFTKCEEVKGTSANVSKPKKSKLPIVLVVLGVLLMTGIALSTIYFIGNQSIVKVADIDAQLEEVYTSNQHIELKAEITEESLEVYYTQLEEIKAKGKEDTTELENELTTISYYIKDNATVESYRSEDFNLSATGLVESLDEIQERVKNSYSVAGLALNLNDKIVSVRTAYDNYSEIKAELKGIENVISFDESKYLELINNITYTNNYKELKTIIDKLTADKNLAQTQLALSQLESQEDVEEDVLAKAKKDWEDAKVVQASAEKTLIEVEKSLVETLKNSENLGEKEESESNLLDDVNSESLEGELSKEVRE